MIIFLWLMMSQKYLPQLCAPIFCLLRKYYKRKKKRLRNNYKPYNQVRIK